jgi:hypothetical protein
MTNRDEKKILYIMNTAEREEEKKDRMLFFNLHIKNINYIYSLFL